MSFLGTIAKAFGLSRTPSNHAVQTEKHLQQPQSQPWGQSARVITVPTSQVYIQIPAGAQATVFHLPPNQPGIFQRSVVYQQPVCYFQQAWQPQPKMAAASNYWNPAGMPARSHNAPPAYTEKAGGSSGITLPKPSNEQCHHLEKLGLDTQFLPTQTELYHGYSSARGHLTAKMNQIPAMNDSALKDTLIKSGKNADDINSLTTRDLKSAAFKQINLDYAKIDSSYRMLYSSIKNR